MVFLDGLNTNRHDIRYSGLGGFVFLCGNSSGAPTKTALTMALDSTFATTNTSVGGNFALAQSTSAAAIVNSATITTFGVGVARVAPTSPVNGIILQAGIIAGQEVWVVNESAAANTVTFAAFGTSHVADGAAALIAGLTARKFVWDSGTSLWYRAA